MRSAAERERKKDISLDWGVTHHGVLVGSWDKQQKKIKSVLADRAAIADSKK